VNRLFSTYRVLAIVVGVLLAFCSLVAMPLRYSPELGLATEGSDLQSFGESASILWVAHGWVFMAYVVVAVLLARRAGWSLGFTLVALVSGLVPLLIFWVERRVTRRYRAEHPELSPVG
jgi:integral membrane protein